MGISTKRYRECQCWAVILSLDNSLTSGKLQQVINTLKFTMRTSCISNDTSFITCCRENCVLKINLSNPNVTTVAQNVCKACDISFAFNETMAVSDVTSHRLHVLVKSCNYSQSLAWQMVVLMVLHLKHFHLKQLLYTLTWIQQLLAASGADRMDASNSIPVSHLLVRWRKA